MGDAAERYVDLAAIGTIADVMPLIGENRTIAKRGLAKMASTEWKGLHFLKKSANIKNEQLSELDSTAIGFRIGPRINAAGRLEDPYMSLQALISDSDDVSKIVERLNEINLRRQEMVRDIIENLEYDENEKIILLTGKWPKGVLGLIAGRITERTGRPSIVMAEKEGVLTGSARSPEFFDITGALKAMDELLSEYGGHRKAAGLSLKKEMYGDFEKNIKQFISPMEIPMPSLEIDCSLSPNEMGIDLLDQVSILKPFGEANPAPQFVLEGVKIQGIKRVGAEGDHLKLRGSFGRKNFSGIMFRAPRELDAMNLSDISVVGQIQKDDYSKEGYSFVINDLKI